MNKHIRLTLLKNKNMYLIVLEYIRIYIFYDLCTSDIVATKYLLYVYTV